MKLSVLIPTYNRTTFLLKNLEMLAGYIRKGNLQGEVELVISNNHSTDKTDEIVKQFKNHNTDIQFRYFLQSENIGLEKNALFVLKEAKGEYVMYLGDDDYIDQEYLINSIKYLETQPKTQVIIPSFIPVNLEGIQLRVGRDTQLPNRHFESGFKNCLTNSWRGHQLSGLVFKKVNLYNIYHEQNVSNIYPFIFFVAYSSLMGDAYHFTSYPVRVTQPGQENKDWNYGDDGLMNEIFDNYKKLPISSWQKTILQIYHYHIERGRLWRYRSRGHIILFRAFKKIWFSNNSTLGFKIVFPLIVFFQITKKIIRKRA